MGNSMGATSWVDGSGQIHLRIYSLQQSNGKLLERCWDSNKWYDGALTNQFSAISGAGATSWLDSSGQIHIRVYAIGTNGKIIELCWDKDKWYSGALTSGQFYGASTPDATSWLDKNGQIHIRVYAYNQDNVQKEYCWDGSKWYVGAYTE
ncbi:fucose-binding lectin [Kordia periserrulae]|uniref:Fucose-binding lectin n=1 Tax=Kordia periserrulae TaxID=701523 RepID=A0A2T6C3M6_9FLAO|nr:hypothetical protein [Kordia periserrulae]PTX62936.1 fucose-binding lectin [Kordia periserrulae]